ncbi:S26 family signal peptidase [Streptomyces albiaxialis]|uniref:S26 family signal peptidase n=1 Tax=Streptomyces albiaxialis TaxID=329523 RepID=A0ABN2VJG1_9ACTN
MRRGHGHGHGRRTVLAVTAAVLVMGARAAARRRLRLIRVTGTSMTPTYEDGERLLVRTGARVRDGDVVVFRNPLEERSPDGPRWLVKRATALPGAPVPPEVLRAVGARPGTRVPRGRLVVRGDAQNTQDSRHFGYVRADAVLGVAVRPRRARA